MTSTRIMAGGVALNIARIGTAPSDPQAVFLHEGLGSIDLWRDFPAAVANRMGQAVLAYDRAGHGRSDPMREPRTTRYLHDAALVELPALLDTVGIEAPVLIGHSDGASIALIHAARHRVKAIVAIAPHVFVEAKALSGIRHTDQQSESLIDRMAHYHDHPLALYRAWRDTWLSPEFESWNIEAELEHIDVPMLLVQGDADEYGTLSQLDRIEQHVRGPVSRHVVSAGDHSPHLSHGAETIDVVAEFVAAIADS